MLRTSSTPAQKLSASAGCPRSSSGWSIRRMSASAGPNDLDALLDDALEAFDQPGPARGGQGAPGPPSATPAASSAAAHPTEAAALEQAWAEAAGSGGSAVGCSTSSAGEASASQPGCAGEAGTSQPKGLSFDPLARGPRRAQHGGSGLPGSSPGGPQPEGVDVLSEGLAKLLAELAQADDEGALAGGGEAGQPPAAQAQQQEQQRELNATLRALSEQAPSFAGAAEGGSEEEMLRLLAEHLGALGGGGEGGEAGGGGSGGGGGAPPEMSSLVDTIMHQLLSKEVLYQPMKDIGAKYPEWLAANRSKLSDEEHERYQRQYGFIQRICALYESSPSDFAQLVDLLQQMQQCGQPPQEIVDELAPGMQFGPDGLPSFGGSDEGLPPELRECTIM